MEVLLAKEIQNNPKWKCHYQLTSKTFDGDLISFQDYKYIVPSFVFPTHFLLGREVVCEGFVFQTVTTFGAPIKIIFQMMGILEKQREMPKIDDRDPLKQASMWKRFLLNLLSSFQHPLPPQGWLEGEYIRWRRPKTKGAQQSLWAFIVISIYSYRIAMRIRKK